MADATIDSFTSDIQALRRELKLLQSDISRLSGGLSGGSSVMPNSMGQVGTGYFQNQVNDYAPLSGLGAVASGVIGRMAARLPSGVRGIASGALTVGGGALQLLAGGMSMMPSMEKYLVRETGYYQAGISSMGALSRNNLVSTTRNALGAGGMTSVGSDATVAAILSGRGVSVGSSLYKGILAQTGDAARVFNQANEVAASSMEALTAGASSASLLQRGIFTSNPLTGEVLNEAQIFEQLARRWNVTSDMSVEDVQDEIRRGFLGANIDSLDMDNAAKERLRMYLLAKAGGAKIDFSSQESMQNWAGNAFGKGGVLENKYENPMAPAYQLAGSETDLIEAFTPSYGKGFKGAADAIGDLQSVVETTADAFGELNAFLSTFLGSDTGSGFAAGGAIFVGGAAALDAIAKAMGGAEDSATGGAGLGDVGLGDLLGAPASGGVTAGYGKVGNQFWDGSHNGIDYGVPEGTPVRAAYDGKVSRVGNNSRAKSYGKYIVLEHGNGWTTTYAHLSEILVREQQQVKKGEIIGKSGSTGTDQAHLHFEVKKDGKDKPPSQFNPGGTGGGSASDSLGGLWSGTSYSGGYGVDMGGGATGGGTAVDSMSSGSAVISSSSSGSSSPQVVITVNVQSASEDEARRFAQIVKQELEEENFVSRMGAK